MAVFGDTLRQARAYKGVTLKEAEQKTRINRHHLAALEDENFGVLPPLIYQRGIVRNYATYLDLDPGKLLPMFEAARGGDSTAKLVAAVKPLDMPSHWAPNFAIIAFLVVMSAIVFAWVYSASFAQDGASPTMASRPMPTVTTEPSGVLADLPSPTTQPPDRATAPPSSRVAAVVSPPTVRVAMAQPPVSTTVPSPTPRPTAPAAPAAAPIATATATPIPPAPTAPEAAPTSVPEPPTEPPLDQVEPEPSAEEAGVDTIRVIALGEIYVTVANGDGAVLFEGPLGENQSTKYFRAQSFAVTTTSGALTRFENPARPDLGPFSMGEEENATYYLDDD